MVHPAPDCAIRRLRGPAPSYTPSWLGFLGLGAQIKALGFQGLGSRGLGSKCLRFQGLGLGAEARGSKISNLGSWGVRAVGGLV